MANLMNVNPMTMGPGADSNEGSVPKVYFKHVGELADESKAKVIVLYRTVPSEPNNCLVVGTKFLPEMYHIIICASRSRYDSLRFALSGVQMPSHRFVHAEAPVWVNMFRRGRAVHAWLPLLSHK